MENNIFDTVSDLLLEQMLKEHFKSLNGREEKYIVTKEQLCQFSMRLILLISNYEKEIKNE